MSDRLPPHAPESEMAVIGSCLIEPQKCLPEAQLVFKTKDYFYDARCQRVWEVLCGMKLESINLISVRQILNDTGIGKQIGVEFLNDCENLVSSTANLPTWIGEVEQKKILRSIITACTDAVGMAYENKNATAVLDSTEERILKIRPSKNDARNIRGLVQDAFEIMEKRAFDWDAITGYSTGIPDLDKKTDGIHPGEFIVIGAPTSCGKTALALNIVMHNAMTGIPSAFLSAEMLPAKLTMRAICAEAKTNARKISENDFPRLTAAAGKISTSPVQIDNIAGFTIGQVRAYARRMKQQDGIKILGVENIQLLSGSGDNREQEIANISRGLKAMAMELQIVVIGLSQLNEEGRLRESRAIGQDSDSTWIIANDGEWRPLVQPVILKIEKSRDGETGNVPLIFRKEFTAFEQAEKFQDDETKN